MILKHWESLFVSREADRGEPELYGPCERLAGVMPATVVVGLQLGNEGSRFTSS